MVFYDVNVERISPPNTQELDGREALPPLEWAHWVFEVWFTRENKLIVRYLEYTKTHTDSHVCGKNLFYLSIYLWSLDSSQKRFIVFWFLISAPLNKTRPMKIPLAWWAMFINHNETCFPIEQDQAQENTYLSINVVMMMMMMMMMIALVMIKWWWWWSNVL